MSRGSVARLAVAPLLLLALCLVVDLPAALARLAAIEPRWLVGALALVQLQVVLSALRWRLSAARLGQRIGSGRAIAEYYLATLLNQTLPGGVAGDALRVARSAPRATTARAAQSVLVERLGGQLALLGVTLVGVLAWPWLIDARLPRVALEALVGVLALVMIGAALLVLLARGGPPRLRRFVAGIAPALRRAWLEDGVWLPQALLSVTIVASYVGVFALAAHALAAPLPSAALLTIVPLALASMLLPVSVGGWGVREAAAAALWPLVGLSAEAGVATSVLYGLVSLVGTLPGLIVALAPRSRGGRGPATRWRRDP